MSDQSNSNSQNNGNGGRGRSNNGGRGSYGCGNNGGRGNGNNRGRGNSYSRYNNNNSNRNSNNNNSSKKKKEKGATEALGDAVFEYSTRRQIEQCNETIKKIATYIGKEYKECGAYVRYAIEQNEDPDLEKPDALTEEDQKDLNKVFEWQENMKSWMKRRDVYKNGKKQAYNLTWGQCTKMMQTELQGCDDYDNMNKTQDLMLLLKNIKEISYNF